MQVFEDLPSFKAQYQHCVATIGKYDGMHLGHQSILKRVLEEAESLSLPAVAILSEPQPEEFFAGDKAPARLNRFQDKVEFLEKFGFAAVYRLNFDLALSQLSANSFINDILVAGLGIKSLIVGDDFRFGQNRQGDFALLQSEGQKLGFTVKSESSCCLEDERVSSTLVRELLAQGRCEKVKSLLGRNYSMSGEVVLGKQLGRELGAPTANIDIDARSLPLQGVFAVEVSLGKRALAGVASIGYNPTIADNLKASLEVHIFDFNEDVYGECLTVSFVKKLRDETKFSNLEALKQQIIVDIEQAKKVFSCTLSKA